MNKILIIGQAPPAVKQTVPYDTTLLYIMFEWVGISKERAQLLFDFDACVDEFPGHGKNGHLVPSKEKMIEYHERVLKHKIKNAKCVIFLGKVASEFYAANLLVNPEKYFSLPHPSTRNRGLIMKRKDWICEILLKAIKLNEQ